jgi:hypothetical protein
MSIMSLPGGSNHFREDACNALLAQLLTQAPYVGQHILNILLFEPVLPGWHHAPTIPNYSQQVTIRSHSRLRTDQGRW